MIRCGFRRIVPPGTEKRLIDLAIAETGLNAAQLYASMALLYIGRTCRFLNIARRLEQAIGYTGDDTFPLMIQQAFKADLLVRQALNRLPKSLAISIPQKVSLCNLPLANLNSILLTESSIDKNLAGAQKCLRLSLIQFGEVKSYTEKIDRVALQPSIMNIEEAAKHLTLAKEIFPYTASQ